MKRRIFVPTRLKPPEGWPNSCRMVPLKPAGRGIVCVVVALSGGYFAGCARPAPAAAAPAEVQVVTVEARDVPIVRDWIGTLDGLVNAQIRAEVTGYLVKQDYKEGSFVHKG